MGIFIKNIIWLREIILQKIVEEIDSKSYYSMTENSHSALTSNITNY